METSNLASLIQSFSKTEIREVQRFLESPFFNTRDDLRRLFEYLCQDLKPHKAQVWLQLFPDKPFDDTAFRLLMSYLNRLLEKYLVLKEFERDDLKNQLCRVVAYRRRGLAAQNERHFRALVRQLEDQPLRNQHYLETQRDLAFERQQTITTSNPTDTKTYRVLMETTDAHYLATRLRLLCLETAQKNVYRSASTDGGPALPTFVDQTILDLARHEQWNGYPAIQIYLKTLEMLTHPGNDAHYIRLKSLLETHAHAFAPEEMRELYLAAVNHCIRQLNEGNTRFMHEALLLYRTALQAGFLFEEGFLSRFTYHNIVAAGLRAGELQWVRQFIHEYLPHLEKQYRETSFSFNLARVELAEGRYDSVLSLLQHANYRDPLLNLPAKVLLMKTFFALGAAEALQSHLEAMRNYIHRSEVIGYHRINYLNIIRYMEKILKTNSFEKAKVEKLRLRLRHEKVLSERDWLLNCLEEQGKKSH